MDAAIDVQRLRVVRGGNEVLHDITLAVRRGSVTGLLGPSGCGKTTLMGSIVGVQIVAGGAVTVLGEAAGAAALRSRVGYVTQAPSVYSDLTVVENLRYFARVVGVGAERVEAVIETVGLGGRGCRWRARCCTSRSCWCSTSRRSGSIPCCAPSCGRRSTGLPSVARRCSSPAT